MRLFFDWKTSQSVLGIDPSEPVIASFVAVLVYPAMQVILGREGQIIICLHRTSIALSLADACEDRCPFHLVVPAKTNVQRNLGQRESSLTSFVSPLCQWGFVRVPNGHNNGGVTWLAPSAPSHT